MKQKALLVTAALCAVISAGAQNVDFNITISSSSASEGLNVHIQEVIPEPSHPFTVLKPGESSAAVSAKVKASPFGIYRMYCTDSQSQYALPIYVAPGDSAVSFGLEIKGYPPLTTLTDPSNRALYAFQKELTDKSIALNRDFESMSDTEITSLLSSLIPAADSIIATLHPVASVADFLRIWSYNSTFESIDQINYLSRVKGRGLVIDPSSILPPPSTVLDTPMAASFMTTLLSTLSTLPKGTIEERLEALYDNYSTPELRKMAAESLAKNFVDNYNYGDGSEDGEKRLAAMTEKYNLPESLLTTFRSRSVVLKGKPFPAVKLQDREGHPVDFDKFKGKWVYIDLWASWCGPCCKEVPSLQKLEKEMAGSNVEFVSISLDSSRDAWLKRMDQLGMHGNQLWDSDSSLASSLNVKGIPHFLIYDPQGCLHTYKATRPSDPATLETLKSLK